jgi:hypothetical protein
MGNCPSCDEPTPQGHPLRVGTQLPARVKFENCLSRTNRDLTASSARPVVKIHQEAPPSDTEGLPKVKVLVAHLRGEICEPRTRQIA